MLSPKQIWTELKFADLRNNIIQSDFFTVVNNHLSSFDLVIGNPPFNPPVNQEGKTPKPSDYYNIVKNGYGLDVADIGDRNPALLFLDQSIRLLKKSGLLCLIQPTVSLLYTELNSTFRNSLFMRYSVPQIVDFTFFRRILFPNATVPTVAIFLEKKKPKDEITHIVVRRTNSGKERLFFEIDQYDIHKIELSQANNHDVYKSNLLGGNRLHFLVERIKGLNAQTIEQYYGKHLKIKSGWKKADVSKFEAFGIFVSRKVTHGSFPLLVNSENYTSENWGAVSTTGADNLASVVELQQYIIKYRELLSTYIVATSARQGLDRPYNINSNDLSTLPRLSSKFKLTLDESIIVNDVVKYRISEFGQGENAEINKEIEIKSETIPFHLRDFAKIYIGVLNSVYCGGNARFYLKEVSASNAFFACSFIFSENKIVSPQKMAFQEFELPQHQTPGLICNRTLRYYSKKKITIVKPKHLRYWIKSIALVDADDTLNDILTTGFTNDDK